MPRPRKEELSTAMTAARRRAVGVEGVEIVTLGPGLTDEEALHELQHRLKLEQDSSRGKEAPPWLDLAPLVSRHRPCSPIGLV